MYNYVIFFNSAVVVRNPTGFSMRLVHPAWYGEKDAPMLNDFKLCFECEFYVLNLNSMDYICTCVIETECWESNLDLRKVF